jgi:hypothetical protein
MNIKFSSINNLLKLTLILSISLAVVSSVSAQNQDGSQSSDKRKIENQKFDSTKELEAIQKQLKTLSSELKPLLSELKQPESFPIKDSLIYIDLPIVLALLLLWFLNKNQQQQLFSQIDKRQNHLLGKLNQLDELDRKLNNLDKIKHEIIKEIQENNQKSIDSEVRLRELISKQQINQSINHHSNIGLYSNNDSSVSNSDRSPPEQLDYQSNKSNFNSIAVVDNIPQFIKMYNRNKYFLSDEVIATVAEIQESLNQKHLGDSNTVTFQSSTKKKYWIIEENNVYYLIPHAKIKIDEYNIKNLESLFECMSFHSEFSDFQLIESAIVFNNDSKIWQLERKGKIKFI